MNTISGPGLQHQSGLRTVFRIAGIVLVPLGVAAFVWGLVGVFGTDDFEGPAGVHIVALLGGVPLIGLGAFCVQAGFLGVAARYGAAEAMPAVRDSAALLRGDADSGPACRSCGRRNDEDASFCDGCGTSLA